MFGGDEMSEVSDKEEDRKLSVFESRRRRCSLSFCFFIKKIINLYVFCV